MYIRSPGLFIKDRKSRLQLFSDKRLFYKAANSVFGKIGRIASEEVTLQLVKSKCIPILLYGLEVCELSKSQMASLDFSINRFLPYDAMHKRGYCRHAVSVRLFVTFVSCAKTNKDIFEIFSPSDSQAILVFPCQTGWRYSDGNPPNEGVECRWGRQKRDSERISLHTLHTCLQCCKPYESRSVKNKATTDSV